MVPHCFFLFKFSLLSLCWVFVAVPRFSLVGEQGLLSSYSLVYELLIAAVSLVEGMGTQ